MVGTARLRCPRPHGAGGTNYTRLHAPPHSFRRLTLRSATRKAQRCHPYPISEFGLIGTDEGSQMRAAEALREQESGGPVASAQPNLTDLIAG